MIDEWTPLFQHLEEQVSLAGRRDLLRKCIEQIEAISQLNLGRSGIDRPSEWKGLSAQYALDYHEGDQTPTLILSGEMLRSFKSSVDNNSATLTNEAIYASDQQEGDPSKGLPARPFFPVTLTGELTPFTLTRLREILDVHFEVG